VSHQRKNHSTKLPNPETSTPIRLASGVTQASATSNIPTIMMMGVTSANRILAMGAESGKFPEKYIMYGSINMGAESGVCVRQDVFHFCIFRVTLPE
jgi:hypothetical protein